MLTLITRLERLKKDVHEDTLLEDDISIASSSESKIERRFLFMEV